MYWFCDLEFDIIFVGSFRKTRVRTLEYEYLNRPALWRSDPDLRDFLLSSEWNVQLDWWTGTVRLMVVHLLSNSTYHSNRLKFLVLRRLLWNARRNSRNSIEHIAVWTSSFPCSQRNQCYEARVLAELLFGQLFLQFSLVSSEREPHFILSRFVLMMNLLQQ